MPPSLPASFRPLFAARARSEARDRLESFLRDAFLRHGRICPGSVRRKGSAAFKLRLPDGILRTAFGIVRGRRFDIRGRDIHWGCGCVPGPFEEIEGAGGDWIGPALPLVLEEAASDSGSAFLLLLSATNAVLLPSAAAFLFWRHAATEQTLATGTLCLALGALFFTFAADILHGCARRLSFECEEGGPSSDHETLEALIRLEESKAAGS